MNATSCTRCPQTIGLTEPYAMLECSLRSYAGDAEGTIEVAHAVGFGPLCRTCSEQLQLTSPAVAKRTKLLRSVQAIPDLVHARAALPPLPALFLASPGGLQAGEYCWGCEAPLRDHTNWLDISLAYERKHWNALWERAEIEVLDSYVTFSLCRSCWRQIPLPVLSGDVALTARWVAWCAHLLE